MGTSIIDLDLGVLHTFWTLLTLTISFDWYVVWLIFHIIVSNNTSPWVPKYLTLWPWPGCLTYFLKTLTLALCFEWYAQGLWYIMCVPCKKIQHTWPWCFLKLHRILTLVLWFYLLFYIKCSLARPFHGDQHFRPCDLEFGFWLTFWKC
jgi:hypothetical protein